MKQLLQSWNKFLSEGIDPRIDRRLQTIKSLPGLGIQMRYYSPEWVVFTYCVIIDDNGNTSILQNKQQATQLGMTEPYGLVSIQKNKNDVCLGAWEIEKTEAASGWGPLLYEVAIEWASANGAGLTSDQNTVSPDALAVWNKYLERADVVKKQLDADMPRQRGVTQLTPNDPTDDCGQDPAILDKGKQEWFNSSLSKVYYKPNQDVINTLGPQFIVKEYK